jgi:DNA-binding transcriptional MerR regulator
VQWLAFVERLRSTGMSIAQIHAYTRLLQVAVVHLGLLNAAFGTVPLTAGQWLLCATMASAVLWASELRKMALRRWTKGK